MKEEQNIQNFQNTKSIPRLVLSNAIPAVLAMIMVLVYNMADMFFIGQTNDPLQVASVSLATPVFMIFMAISSVFGIGGTSLISRSFGKGKFDYAKKVSSFCLWSVVILGTLLSALIVIFANPLSGILGASSDTSGMVINYLSIVGISGPFLLASSVFSNIIRAEGSPKTAMMGLAIGNIINIILDPIFILGLGLGVSGAAIATVIGNFSGAVFYIFYIKRGKSKLSIKLKDFTFDKYTIKNVLSIGIPASLSSVLMSTSTIIVNGLMSGYGDLAVAGIGVTMKVTMITSFVCIGFGQGVQPILGFAYGAKDNKKFKDVMRFSLLFSLAIGVVMTAFCYLALEQIVSAFLTDAAAFGYAVSFTRILLMTTSLFGMLFVFANAVQAIGAATSSLIIGICRKGVFFIPIVFILNSVMGMYGIIYTQPIADAMAFIVAAVLYKITIKKYFQKNTQSVDNKIAEDKGEEQLETALLKS